MLIPTNNIVSEIRHRYDLGFYVMRCRSVWPIFNGWVILLNLLKTIWWIDVKCLNNALMWCSLWPQNKCRSMWPIYISWFSDFVLYLEDYLIYVGHTWDTASVWHKDWPDEIYEEQWPIFHSPVIKLNILKTIWCSNGVLGIVNQYGTKINLIKYMYMWVNDLYYMVRYFMVQWFLPYIFKNIWWINVICGTMDQCDAKIDFIIVCRSVAYISWSNDFA